MRIFGLAGWSGSGKTTLMTALIPEFVSRGLTVSTIKHAHHAFDIDQPGKDSWRHRQAGAREVMVASGQRWALMHELRGAAEPSLDELLARMTPVDLVLVEGFKHHPSPEDRGLSPVARQAAAASRRPAVSSRSPPMSRCAEFSCPGCRCRMRRAIADFILGQRGRAARDGAAER